MNRRFAAALTSLLTLALAGLAFNQPASRAMSAEAPRPSPRKFAAGGAAPPPPSPGATCFCKITANGVEVDKRTSGGYIQHLQRGRCQDYCKGQWDTSSEQQRSEWARRLPGACGNVTVRMEAAIGTAGYEQVRSATIHLGAGPNPCPYGGSYDGANCLVAAPPPSAQPFIHRNNFYYSAVSSDPATRCPVGSWDGAHCRVGDNPDEAAPFIYGRRFYLVSACDDRNNWTGWRTGVNAFGDLYVRTKHRKAELRWELTSAGVNTLGQAASGSGLNPAAVEYIKVCRKEGALGDPCNHATSIITAWQPGAFAHDLKSNQLYKFRVLIKKNGGGEFIVGDAVRVTTK